MPAHTEISGWGRPVPPTSPGSPSARAQRATRGQEREQPGPAGEVVPHSSAGSSAPAGIKTSPRGLGPEARTRSWAGGAGASLRCPDLRLAGEAARAPIRPGLSHLRLASSATARCASLTPSPNPSRARGAICSRPEPSRVPGPPRPRPPQPCREDAPSLRPAGAFQNHRHTRFHASAKSDAYRQSGQQMTILSAKRGKSGEGVGVGWGEKGAKGQW